MLNPTCVKCHKELTCIKNGVMLVHYIDNDNNNKADAVRLGDKYRCVSCGAEVIIGLSTSQVEYPEADKMLEYNLTAEVVEVIR